MKRQPQILAQGHLCHLPNIRPEVKAINAVAVLLHWKWNEISAVLIFAYIQN